MLNKEKSLNPEEFRLGDLVLPQKEKAREILSGFHREVNPCEVSDLVLGPFYEMMGRMNPGRK